MKRAKHYIHEPNLTIATNLAKIAPCPISKMIDLALSFAFHEDNREKFNILLSTVFPDNSENT